MKEILLEVGLDAALSTKVILMTSDECYEFQLSPKEKDPHGKSTSSPAPKSPLIKKALNFPTLSGLQVQRRDPGKRWHQQVIVSPGSRRAGGEGDLT